MLDTKPFLIIRTGGTFPDCTSRRGDFEDWTASAMGLDVEDCLIVNVQAGERLPNPDDYCGCALTGSHDMVTDENLAWIENSAAWLREAVAGGLPVFGICFGHQLLAHALGGKAGFHPEGPEIGTMDITLTDEADSDPIFSCLPTCFPGHTTHYQAALALPEGACLLARSAHEPHQAFRFGRHAWGVQFHPEFQAEDMRIYIVRQAEAIRDHGGDVESLLCNVRETPDSTDLLARFVDYCLYAVR